MKPMEFNEANKLLKPSDKEYSESVGKVSDLPVWTDGERCVSCWKMSWRERLSALFFGKAWVSLLSGFTQPPVAVNSTNSFFKK